MKQKQHEKTIGLSLDLKSRIAGYTVKYQFNDYEQTLSVMLDFIQDPAGCTTFYDYVKRFFPSKFTV